MRSLLVLAVAVLYAALVAALDGQGLPSVLIGAICALALWVMLFAGSYATPRRGIVAPEAYGTAAVVALAVGWMVVTLLDLGSGFWAVGIIVGGAVVPATGAARGDRGESPTA